MSWNMYIITSIQLAAAQLLGKGQEEHVRFLGLELAGCFWNLYEPTLPLNGVDPLVNCFLEFR